MTEQVRALAELVRADQSVTPEELREAAVGLEEETVRALLDVRARLDRLRARDRELSSLMASLRELVEVRDVQRLLQKLVDRAHELMGTDLTYLSEYDEATDELLVRANRGTISSNMRDLRVPAGIGLASKVVQTRTPQWTAAYDAAAFPHESEVTAAVEAEHMESILGVPLISSDRVLGVLFAADRSAHTFSSEQISLLTAFADQAAVILQSARLLAAERESAANAAAARAEAEQRASAMEGSASLHERLTRLVLEGEGSSAIARILAESLGRPVAIADRDLAPLATSDDRAAGWWSAGRLGPEVSGAIEKSRGTARWVDVGTDVLGVVAAMAGRTLLGVLLVGGDPLDEVQRRTVERGAQSHALVTMQRDAIADAEERVRGELVGDLVSGRQSWNGLRHRASQRGVNLAGSWTPVVTAGWKQQRWSLVRALSGLDSGWLVAQHDAGVVALVPGSPDSRQLADRVHARLALGGGTGLVLIGSTTRIEDIPGEVAELSTLSRMLPGIGVSDAAVMGQDYAPYLALFGPDGDRALAFARGLLDPLLAWDTSHRSDLVRTLDAFLTHNASVTRAAAALFVHPNTVKQRLERIDQLLPGWRRQEARFRLGIALQLHSLSRSDTP
ncbi:GAF domain-containing protein [Nocardioides albertanoniae]|uniref:GAF domain-containing protein n=1 Tax=Nocardioides albertanoniae TaxID=1175486 RepID=A0A543A7I8_9ACTN|nr:GAF domain-containing protein [Nocardioides albertanoniae]TQL68565.1 GAF domain-containing protein [Nocardioides albertanoniae]